MIVMREIGTERNAGPFRKAKVGWAGRPFGLAGIDDKRVPRSCVLCKGGYYGHLQ